MNMAGYSRLRAKLILSALSVALVAACASEPSIAQPSNPPTDAPTQTLPTPTVSPDITITPDPVTPSPAVAPTPVPTPTPLVFWLPPGSPLPPTQLPLPSPSPEPTDDALIPVATGDSPPTRIYVPALGINLAVIKGNTEYPYCNVSQYLPLDEFVNPGHAGSTYLYGHARTGMFLPFLTRSKIDDGASMIGMKVYLYTADKKLHLYRINIVKRHTRDFSLALDLEPGQHRLIMQTSEGPNGTYPKLQIAARPIGVYKATAAEALPTPHPKIC